MKKDERALTKKGDFRKSMNIGTSYIPYVPVLWGPSVPVNRQIISDHLLRT
jgi:hypothetical protein